MDFQVSPLTCFVIMPIGDKHAPHGSDGRIRYEESIQTWELVIEPACLSLGLEAIRGDRIAEAGEITEQIFRLLHDAEVVVADVTNANPNVMYELGLRHTIPKLTIQIGQVNRLPFDIGAIRTIRFERTELGLIEARQQLESALRASLAGNATFVTATRIWNESTIPVGTASAEATASEADDDEPPLLDALATSEEALPKLVENISGAAQVIEQINAVTLKAAEDIKTSDARGAGMGGRLLIANQYAGDLGLLAENLEESVAGYAERMRLIDPGIKAMLRVLESDPAQLAFIEQFDQAIHTLAAQVRESKAALTGMAVSVGELGKLSRHLREPSRRIARALHEFSGASAVMLEWDRRLSVLRDRGSGALNSVLRAAGTSEEELADSLDPTREEEPAGGSEK